MTPPQFPYSFWKNSTPAGPWPSTPTDGDLSLNAGLVTYTDGTLKTFRDFLAVNGSTVIISGSVQIGVTRNFRLDATSSIIGALNNTPGEDGYSGGAPQAFTYGPYTTPSGETYSYTVTGALGGIGGDSTLSVNTGGNQYNGNGGGGASDSDNGGGAVSANGGEGAASSFGASGGGGGGPDTDGSAGETSGFATAGGGGGGGAGTGLPSKAVFYLKLGASAVVVDCTGFISFVGGDGRTGGGGGGGGGNVGVINSGGGAGSAGGFAGKMIAKIPTAQAAAWNPVTDFSGGAPGLGGGGGSSGGATSGSPGTDGASGQTGEYTVVTY